jgi:hypothetical protein
VIRWEVDGPYEVAFSTRLGGVSEGPYASANLGLLTDDDAEHVHENRRRLCATLHADEERLAMNRQVHGAIVHKAVAGRRGEPGDGLWTDEPGVPVLAVVADCLPVALARVDGPPAVAVLHAGRLGLLEGVLANGVAQLGMVHAAIGPGIGPCCYEVGDDIRADYAERFGPDVVHGRNLDLWTSAERALRAAGVEKIERTDLCTACNPELFFSHRRDGGVTGRQGVIAYVT